MEKIRTVNACMFFACQSDRRMFSLHSDPEDTAAGREEAKCRGSAERRHPTGGIENDNRNIRRLEEGFMRRSPSLDEKRQTQSSGYRIWLFMAFVLMVLAGRVVLG